MTPTSEKTLDQKLVDELTKWYEDELKNPHDTVRWEPVLLDQAFNCLSELRRQMIASKFKDDALEARYKALYSIYCQVLEYRADKGVKVLTGQPRKPLKEIS